MGILNRGSLVTEVCANVKRLGFAARERIRLYGEEFEVMSDPFEDGEGVALNVRSKKDANIRVLRLPVTILQTAKPRAVKAA